MTPFESFKLYSSIKNHFTLESYDFFKYNGKVRASEHTFETRKDKYMFYKLSKRSDALEYLVANLSENPKLWVGELFDPKYEQIYSSFIKRKESLSYIFENDVDKLLENFDDNFKVEDGDYPYLLKLLVQNKITKETFIIINDCVRFAGKWNKQIADPVLWPQILLNCKKLHPFLEYDKAKYCSKLREKFS